MKRAILAGCFVALASGWNTANIGPLAEPLARSYGVGLAAVGLFTTALFTTHFLMQVPSGKLSQRFGARHVTFAGLAILFVFNALALMTPEPALAIATRAAMGIGTALSFLAASAYVRESGGSAFAQGLFGAGAMAGAGLALGVVAQLGDPLGWRAPYWSAVGVSALAIVLLALAPPVGARRAAEPPSDAPGMWRDRRLYRLAVSYSAALGFSLVVGNWVVELLTKNGDVGREAAGVIGALTLLLGALTRPLGGWIHRSHPQWTRAAIAASLAAGGLGTLALVAAQPTGVAVMGGVLVGLAAGLPFAPAFAGAALARPDAPAAAVGAINSLATGIALAGTPLLGLTFSLPGDGRIGFVVVAALWLAALAVLPSRRDLGIS